MPEEKKHYFLKKQANWYNLAFYKKAEVLYQMTRTFCDRFIKDRKDRTIDQMVQAARSGKQNIVEGSADGASSTEMEIKLLNVARSSIQELREDYHDYLIAKKLIIWKHEHPRFQPMIDFCRPHNDLADYQPFFDKWTDEEMANIALTLCHMVDSLMNKYLREKEEQFVKEGGIKERMHAARTGYRKEQGERVAFLERENQELKAEIKRLQELLRNK